MALSMDEQRMLAEIERHLAAEDPALATRMSTFRRPARAGVFRSTRARVIGSLLTVAVVAVVSLMVYAMLPFRSGGRTTGNHPVTTVSNSGPAKIGAQTGKGPAAKKSAAAVRSSSDMSAGDGTSGYTGPRTTAKGRAGQSADAAAKPSTSAVPVQSP